VLDGGAARDQLQKPVDERNVVKQQSWAESEQRDRQTHKLLRIARLGFWNLARGPEVPC
jgi:hypothetical protein